MSEAPLPATLLPCPFCGGNASLAEGRNGDGTPFTYIECGECRAMAEMEWWNKRVEPEVKSVMTCMCSGCCNAAEPMSNWCVEHRLKSLSIGAGHRTGATAYELQRALRNVALVARRELARKQSTPDRTREMWSHVLRFCCEAGVDASVLREVPHA